MNDFLKVLPFVLGAAVSPVLLVMTLFILSRPKKPILKTLLFLLAGAITISVIAIIVFFTARVEITQPGHSDTLPHTIIGVLLLLLALDIYRRGPQKSQQKEKKTDSSLKYFLLGLVLMLTNFTTIAMIFEVALELRALSITGMERGFYLALTIFSSLLPILIPLFILLVAGKNSQKILKDLSGFMQKRSYLVTSLFFAALAIYILAKTYL